jgi:hypothetical protein
MISSNKTLVFAGLHTYQYYYHLQLENKVLDNNAAYQEVLEDTKEVIRIRNSKKNTMAKRKSTKIYHTVRTVQQSNRNIIETEEKSLTLSSCYGYFSSTVKLVLLVQTSPAK